MSNQQTIGWLRELAAAGGKGVVHNIDARSLGRIADELERLTAQEKDYRNLTRSLLDMGGGDPVGGGKVP
jgi:hypothetical protein